MFNNIGNLNVVVIGGIHHNTLGVIRSLGESGISRECIHVLLADKNYKKDNIITKCSYINREYVGFVDDYCKIVEWLTNLAKDGTKRVIICCSDGAAEVVINNSEYLSKWYRTPSTEINASELMDKDFQDKLAVDCGLNVPASAVIRKTVDLQWNQFPCITKPIKSIAGAGKQDILVINTVSDLKKSLDKIEADTIQIQEYINKEMEFQLIGCSLNRGESIIIPGYTIIIRQPKNTNTGYLKYSPIDKLDFDLNPVYNFIKKIGYSGLFSVEFIRATDGKDYFLEINMRNDGNAYCVQSAGVNLPYIWSYYQTFGELPESSTTINKEVYFIPDFDDLRVAMNTVGFVRWLRDFISADSHTLYNKRDMKPFIFEFSRLIRNVLHI